jgi:hypothetical protein
MWAAAGEAGKSSMAQIPKGGRVQRREGPDSDKGGGRAHGAASRAAMGEAAKKRIASKREAVKSRIAPIPRGGEGGERRRRRDARHKGKWQT